MDKQGMNQAAKIAGGVFFIAICFWVLEAAGCFLLNTNRPDGVSAGSFYDIMVMDIPSYSLFIRLLFLAVCVVCGSTFYYSVQRKNRKHRESDRLCSHLMNAVNEGVAVINGNGDVISVNNNLLEMFGLSAQDIINKPATHFWQATGAGEPFSKIPDHPSSPLTISRNHHGMQMAASVVRHKIKDGAGGVSGEIIVVTETTRRMQMSQEIRLLSSELEQSKKNEALGKITGGAAHELNNLLSGIISYPELLLTGMDDGHPMKRPIYKTQQAGVRAAELVNDLLTITREDICMAKEVIHFDQFIREQLESTETRMIRHRFPGIDIFFGKNMDSVAINASPVCIKKIVMNLILNAIESIQKTGVIRISLRSVVLGDSDHRPDQIECGKYAVLTVRDNGAEIGTKDLNRIFEPFYTKKIMGRNCTGLGLTVVQRIAESYQGAVTVASTRAGSRFDVYLPCKDEAAGDCMEASRTTTAAGGNGEIILVVDDEEDQREIACAMLKKLRYTPIAFQCGEEAIFHLRDHSADLLLLDMMMQPYISGLETFCKVLSFKPDQKAMIVSGLIDARDEVEARRMGISTILKKPYNLDLLGRAVQEELKKS